MVSWILLFWFKICKQHHPKCNRLIVWYPHYVSVTNTAMNSESTGWSFFFETNNSQAQKQMAAGYWPSWRLDRPSDSSSLSSDSSFFLVSPLFSCTNSFSSCRFPTSDLELDLRLLSANFKLFVSRLAKESLQWRILTHPQQTRRTSKNQRDLKRRENVRLFANSAICLGRRETGSDQDEEALMTSISSIFGI